ncbi:MAG: hypothetical protein GTN65_13370, partial [Armatimonadetes bacterium]|nr:hypothetical protein [Armatimonadota bacterium]NIO98049.1 hypothetical protein [Armatimonadota bacterium]
MVTVMWIMFGRACAQTLPSELKYTPTGTKAELSVRLSDSSFAFGTNLLDVWLTPQTSVIANDGAVAENFVGR